MAQDTLVSGVAGRYASALFSLAQDDRKSDAVAQSLAKLDRLIAENPDLERLVRSPVFSAKDQLGRSTPFSPGRTLTASPPISSVSSR